ncbi:stress-response A/B barrel domain-containing protein UP3-like [Salvia splendens]|uniref:stress-response A/B barrel domain-containing protein UP3-like n=1 Tax=Salvia splendens TaxID=180675 RepID=UPI001C26EC72|nr:stress-response A/B barrel domain-containing protein UP3-like [Salvia splendens]
MSSSAPSQIIEHVVLLKAKPSADPSAVNEMIRNLNGLATLDSVLHISAGPVSRCRSTSLTFTHMLHSRYRSKSDLASYTHDPVHVAVVAGYVKPVVDDVMAVDWVAEDFSGPVAVGFRLGLIGLGHYQVDPITTQSARFASPTVAVPPGAALRLKVMKVKDKSGKGEVLEIARGMKGKFDAIEQLTAGENFSPERSKGFSIASIAVVKELEALGVVSDVVSEHFDDVVVLDYAVPAQKPAAAARL